MTVLIFLLFTLFVLVNGLSIRRIRSNIGRNLLNVACKSPPTALYMMTDMGPGSNNFTSPTSMAGGQDTALTSFCYELQRDGEERLRSEQNTVLGFVLTSMVDLGTKMETLNTKVESNNKDLSTKMESNNKDLRKMESDISTKMESNSKDLSKDLRKMESDISTKLESNNKELRKMESDISTKMESTNKELRKMESNNKDLRTLVLIVLLVISTQSPIVKDLISTFLTFFIK